MIVPHAQISADTLALYQAGGLPPGESTGWPSVDQFYTVGLGQWTLVTGTPNSGKSEWLDALMVNLAKQGGWRFLIYSPENWPLALHHSKIVEKYVGKPFGPGPTPRMTPEELDDAETWIHGKFHFAKYDRPLMMNILEEAAEFLGPTTGPETKRAVIVDPWNQLEHYRPRELSETEYVSQTLSDVIRVVREANWHLWIVAHPAKLQRDRDGSYPVPRPYDVSGSAHWWNKADNCVTVWRDQAQGTQQVQIHVQKVRFKHIGRIGVAELRYDRVTGRYHEILRPVPSTRSYQDAKDGRST